MGIALAETIGNLAVDANNELLIAMAGAFQPLVEMLPNCSGTPVKHEEKEQEEGRLKRRATGPS